MYYYAQYIILTMLQTKVASKKNFKTTNRKTKEIKLMQIFEDGRKSQYEYKMELKFLKNIKPWNN